MCAQRRSDGWQLDWNLQIGDIGNDEQQCVHLNDDDDDGDDYQTMCALE